MAWLNNTTAKPILTIGGEDYSNELDSMTISDSSLVSGSMMTTGGTIRLVELPGNHRVEDYGKVRFTPMKVVSLSLEIEGQTLKHPRGHLYVIDASYNPESRSVDISVGCMLTVHSLRENGLFAKSFISAKTPAKLTFSEADSALQAEGKFLWQNNQGQIVSGDFWSGDGKGSNREGASFVCVRDYTCLSSAPLGGGKQPPDKISVTYSWLQSEPNEQETDPDTGKPIDEDSTQTTYFLEHPAQLKKFQKVCVTSGGETVCREVAVNSGKRTFSVNKIEKNTRFYGGPGGSVSQEVRITQGPAVELQGSYFAERYSWDLARAGGVDNGIKLFGLETVFQSRIEKRYEYGAGGEVIKTVEKQYRNILGAMTQSDWRGGGGELETQIDPNKPPESAKRGFLTEVPLNKLYLEAQITTTWDYYEDKTVETTRTLKSSARCNGVGIFPPTGARVLQQLDATDNGVENVVIRTSRGGLQNPSQPSRVTVDVDNKVSKSEVYEDENARFPGLGTTLRTTVPYANDSLTEAQARRGAEKFADYTRRFVEGDAAGIRVVETMRPEIFNYYPGMPFSYSDIQENKLIKLRMNATSWAVSGTEALVATDGLFVGLSNGTVNIPSNVDEVSLLASLQNLQSKQQSTQEKSEAVVEAQDSLQASQDLLDAIEAEESSRP